MILFNVTYDMVTPESAEHGDSAERGFIDCHGQQHDMEDRHGHVAGAIKAMMAMRLRDAVALVGCTEDSGSWFSETDGRQDYRTGTYEYRALHPYNSITASSYNRLARLLGVSR